MYKLIKLIIIKSPQKIILILFDKNFQKSVKLSIKIK
jgi:hypothetical protein